MLALSTCGEDAGLFTATNRMVDLKGEHSHQADVGDLAFMNKFYTRRYVVLRFSPEELRARPEELRARPEEFVATVRRMGCPPL